MMEGTVEEAMTRDPVLVDVGTTITEVAKLMESRRIGTVGVERDGELRGIATDRDLVVRAIARDLDPSAPLLRGDQGHTGQAE